MGCGTLCKMTCLLGEPLRPVLLGGVLQVRPEAHHLRQEADRAPSHPLETRRDGATGPLHQFFCSSASILLALSAFSAVFFEILMLERYLVVVGYSLFFAHIFCVNSYSDLHAFAPLRPQ